MSSFTGKVLGENWRSEFTPGDDDDDGVGAAEFLYNYKADQRKKKKRINKMANKQRKRDRPGLVANRAAQRRFRTDGDGKPYRNEGFVKERQRGKANQTEKRIVRAAVIKTSLKPNGTLKNKSLKPKRTGKTRARDHVMRNTKVKTLSNAMKSDGPIPRWLLDRRNMLSANNKEGCGLRKSAKRKKRRKRRKRRKSKKVKHSNRVLRPRTKRKKRKKRRKIRKSRKK